MLRSKKLSLIFIPLAIILTVLLSFTITASAAQESTISGGHATAHRGDDVALTVNLSNNPGFTYLKISVEYDDTALELVSANNGTLCEDSTFGIYYIWSAVENITDDGTLMTLIFNVKDTASFGNTQISIKCVECVNYDEESVQLNTSYGSIDVVCKHSYNAEMFTKEITPPTCTALGFTKYVCEDCGISYISDYVDKVEHSYIKNTVAPTCTTMGYTEYECENCTSSHICDYIDALGHQYSEVVTSPTCTSMGYTTFVCVCGEKHLTNYVDATGHCYGEWITEKEPSIEEEGVMVRHCTHSCDATETKQIPKLESNSLSISEIALIAIAAGVMLVFIGTICHTIATRKKRNDK